VQQKQKALRQRARKNRKMGHMSWRTGEGIGRGTAGKGRRSTDVFKERGGGIRDQGGSVDVVVNFGGPPQPRGGRRVKRDRDQIEKVLCRGPERGYSAMTQFELKKR